MSAQVSVRVLPSSLTFFPPKYIKYFSLWLEKIRKGKKAILGSLNSNIPHTTIMKRHAVFVADKLGHMMAGEMQIR